MFLMCSISFVLCCFYAVTLAAYGCAFFGVRVRLFLSAWECLVVTILCHLNALMLLAISGSHSLNSSAVALSGLALSLSIAYFLIEWISRERNMGLAVLVLPLVFQVIATLCMRRVAVVDPLPGGALVALHVGLAMVGYCAFSLSAAFSVLYLLLYHEIKIHRLGLVFERLPSLGSLEAMAYRATHFGLGFLLGAVVIGEVVFFQTEGRLVWADAKMFVALVSIVVYGVAILLRGVLSIRGKRSAMFSIGGFGVILFSLLVVDQFLPSFHQY
jgi:ABC-type transport system involved in cytochrome c biogenesis permease subunit